MTAPRPDLAVELRDWLRKRELKCAENAAELSRRREYGDALAWTDMSATYKARADCIDALLVERAAKQKPLFEMSLAELQTLRGQIDSFIQIKVCGDPRIGVSFPAAPQPKGPDDE